jgi:hypothetical protein
MVGLIRRTLIWPSFDLGSWSYTAMCTSTALVFLTVIMCFTVCVVAC